MESTDNFESHSLFQLYKALNLPVDLFDLTEGIHHFQFKRYSVQTSLSICVLPTQFFFSCSKNGSGRYTIDEQSFEVEPHSIYFTNPSNYRTFSWKEIEDILLITFDETFLKNTLEKMSTMIFHFSLLKLYGQECWQMIFPRSRAINVQILNEYRKSTTSKYKIIGHLLAVLLLRLKNISE